MEPKQSAFRREAKLLWQHIRDALEQQKLVSGSLAVTVALWIIGRLLPPLIESLPAKDRASLTGSHLWLWLSGLHWAWIGSVLLAILAIHLAWRKQYLADHPEGPEIDKRLELLEEIPGLSGAPSDTIKEMAKALQVFIEPRPAFTLFAHFTVRAQIESPILYLECDAPIYRAIGRYRKPNFGEQVRAEEIKNLQERAWVQFGNAPLLAGATLSVILSSSVPLRLKRVVPFAPPPADPPSTTASA